VTASPMDNYKVEIDGTGYLVLSGATLSEMVCFSNS